MELDALIALAIETSPELVLPIIPGWEPGTVLRADSYVAWGGQIYRVLQAHTSQADWMPDLTPALYALAHSTTTDPIDRPPDWAQPQGAHDAYKRGDRVYHVAKLWESTVDGNVWEPGVHGWVEVPED